MKYLNIKISPLNFLAANMAIIFSPFGYFVTLIVHSPQQIMAVNCLLSIALYIAISKQPNHNL